jgi:RNA polymerase sigma-70 factor (ECF subfamily)
MPQQPDDAVATFAHLRPRLTRIAYRMLGSVAEAEDVVQDAYLRWHGTDREAVTDAQAYLAKTVTRLCLDHLKSARVKRETYIGPWIPEPMIEPDETLEADDITLTLMMALERLSPLERAAFLLHDVFGQNFDDVAQTIDRDAAACRQLASRAREHVRAAKPRFPVSHQRGAEIAKAFFDASRSGEVAPLQALLANDVVLYSDGGGKRVAALRPIMGDEDVARFFAGLARKPGAQLPSQYRETIVDGLPGLVVVQDGEVMHTMAFEIDDGRITAIYIVRNPDKLRHVSAKGVLH